MKKMVSGLLMGVLGLFFSASASAALTLYTDRAAWALASGSLTTENFNSMASGTPVTAATVFPSGITVTGSLLDISGFAFSSIGQGNALRTFGATTVAMPGSLVSFGFDYADVDQTGATISIGAFSQGLAFTGDADSGVSSDDFAFFGVVGLVGDIPGGVFSIGVGIGEGIMIDNLSFGAAASDVPEPGSLALLGLGLAGLAASLRRRKSA